MNKEEKEYINGMKQLLNIAIKDRKTKIEVNHQTCKTLLKYIDELEQKESILDKATDMLKEIRRELDDDGFGYYAQEITKALNIIEGDDIK